MLFQLPLTSIKVEGRIRLGVQETKHVRIKNRVSFRVKFYD